MGNQVTRHKKAGGGNDKTAPSQEHNGSKKSTTGTGGQQSPTAAAAADSMSRSPSGVDLQSSAHTQFLPIDRLAKILSEISQKEEAVNGITKTVFQKYLFPHYPDLANRLFAHLHTSSKATTAHMGQSAFKQQSEKFLAIMNDQVVLENYVKMFSENKQESEVTPDGLRELLMVSYRLAMAATGGGFCTQLLNTVSAVVTACFHGKDTLSVSYVSNWLSNNSPRIVHGMHRYVIHVLTTAYRSGKVLMSDEQSGPHLVPSTPVLDQPDSGDPSEALLPISHVWLLSTTLPQCYTKTEEEIQNKDSMQALITKMSGTVCPRHWTLLYNSNQHGTGLNRFMHHVLGYKGPTLLFIRGVSDSDDRSTYPTYCVCSAVEWRESHLYWGNEDSIVIEMLPNYRVVQKGNKLLYLNTSIRGYPQGLRAGADPRNPCVIIDQSFNEVTFAGVPYRISSLEVWGCGDTKSRERQLEIKKWQVKEAEKQRVVKLSTSEWLDHPDRYLLELAGRPSYNNSSN